MRVILLLTLLLMSFATARGQWDIQDSGTKASLRGIHSVGKGVAWASGTGGNVLRTEDGGHLWRHCTTPSGAEKLDFRGVQGFDANTAVVMSSGKGDLSRVYKTTDGCQTWKQVLRNPDADGFFDAVVFQADVWTRQPGALVGPLKFHIGYVLGDPVNGNFVLYETRDSGETWRRWGSNEHDGPATALPNEGAFAASNTSVISPGFNGDFAFVSGGPEGPRLHLEKQLVISDSKFQWVFKTIPLPLAKGDAGGAFSVAGRYTPAPGYAVDFMVVGGDYKQPDSTTGTAVFVTGATSAVPTVRTPETPPHGFRSAVVYDIATKAWIAVGPNGTDISPDDGRNWRALKPGPNEAPDADKNWNALSLPFVVGPNGRIGVLRPEALRRVQ